ncbi:hypothetical protein [Natrononativus amylolyticus]|uniref:hypothetical protein n=1 Tax=Natrononativus amylolyticus TaxID=2963434 RepID=UPI0020CF09C7|nr:hypothetical protein [Natrononativus amylolyticus]
MRWSWAVTVGCIVLLVAMAGGGAAEFGQTDQEPLEGISLGNPTEAGVGSEDSVELAQETAQLFGYRGMDDVSYFFAEDGTAYLVVSDGEIGEGHATIYGEVLIESDDSDVGILVAESATVETTGERVTFSTAVLFVLC